MCDGCDILCKKCEMEMQDCEKCNCKCHCGSSCIECGCVGCTHANIQSTNETTNNEARKV